MTVAARDLKPGMMYKWDDSVKTVVTVVSFGRRVTVDVMMDGVDHLVCDVFKTSDKLEVIK